jgi:septal ring factor EnvC (AmiA/AmiB activator)
LATLALSSDVIGQDEKLSAKLTGIRASVDLAEGEILRLREEFNALLKKREELQSNLQKLKDEDKALQRKIIDLRGEEETLKGEVAVAEHNASEHQKRIQSRLRAMYVNSSVSANPLFSGSSQRGDVERLALYARKVRDMDSRIFREASDAVAALVHKRRVLEETIAAEQKAREDLVKKRRDVEAQSVTLKAVSEQLTQKQQTAQRSLAVLRDEARKVEEMIASLTSGSDEQDDVSEETESDDEGEKPASDSGDVGLSPSKQGSMPQAVIYPSIFDSGIKLRAPIKGEVLQGFGRSKVSTFADMVFSKGIDFSSTSASDVHAVLGGKVAFAGTMPGYEQVVVLEHGGRSYSLYGRLGTVSVKTGDAVEQDQVIATSSEPDPKGRNFYFEVRKNGAPVNPQNVLSPVSR